MTGKKGMHSIGRPKTTEGEKAKYRTHAFYFPLRIDHIWKEFDDLCRKEMKDYIFQERCKSIKIRNMIFDYVLSKSKDHKIKQEVMDFIDEDKDKINKHTKINILEE